MPSFHATCPVRFGEIDHAGVMYYPALFDRMHRVFEDFWPTAMGKTYHGVLDGDGIGFPLLDVHATFKRPFKFGDVMTVDLSIVRLGNTSITWRLLLGAQESEGVRASVRMVTAVIAMESFAPTALPDSYREALRPFLAPDGEDAAG